MDILEKNGIKIPNTGFRCDSKRRKSEKLTWVRSVKIKMEQTEADSANKSPSRIHQCK